MIDEGEKPAFGFSDATTIWPTIQEMKDHATLHDLCRLRSTLEAFGVCRWRQCGERLRVGNELRGQLGELQRLAKLGDYLAFHNVDKQFHRAAVAAAGLEPLLKSWEIVVADVEDWILGSKQAYWPNLMALYREHELLLEAWLAEDDWLAEQATHQHLEAGWYRLRMSEGSDATDLDPVQRTVSFIATHFASRLDIEWLASHVSFVSPNHLARLFRSQMGISPLRHLKQVRLERAAQLLCSGTDAVALIATRVGYQNTSHFVRDFRRIFGMTPLDYRRRGDS
ncbi:MAG: helix-turn-helix domain-containing protein [Planctomycetota bacterium]|nr:helix-turn-helix domain-containing protein [Planctomycetota bacterium]